MCQNWWDSSVKTEYVWRNESLLSELEQRVDKVEVFAVLFWINDNFVHFVGSNCNKCV